MTGFINPRLLPILSAAILFVQASVAHAAWKVGGYAPNPATITAFGTVDMEVTGTFESATDNMGNQRRIFLSRNGMRQFEVTGSIVSWNNIRIRIRIPGTLSAGTYGVMIYSPNLANRLVAGQENWQLVKAQTGGFKPGSGNLPRGRSLMSPTLKPEALGSSPGRLLQELRSIKPGVATDMAAAGVRPPHKDPELGIEQVRITSDPPCPDGSVNLSITVRNSGGNFIGLNATSFNIEINGGNPHTVISPNYGISPYSTRTFSVRSFHPGTPNAGEIDGQPLSKLGARIGWGTTPWELIEKKCGSRGTYCDANKANNELQFIVAFKPAYLCP